MKRQATNKDKVFANNFPDGLEFRTYKKLSELNNEKTTQFLNGQKKITQKANNSIIRHQENAN